MLVYLLKIEIMYLKLFFLNKYMLFVKSLIYILIHKIARKTQFILQ